MMEIKERAPVICVPGHVQDEMVAWCEKQHFDWVKDSRRDTAQRVIEEFMYGDASTIRTLCGAWSGVELGLVSSWNDSWVFVKYHPGLHQTGWDITAQATSREDLFERCIVAEDRAFIDVPEYPGYDDYYNVYEAVSNKEDPWYLIGDLNQELRQDWHDHIEAAAELGDGTTERIQSTPLHEWIEHLWVFERDGEGGKEEVAEFNFDTWEWERTPGVQEEAC